VIVRSRSRRAGARYSWIAALLMALVCGRAAAVTLPQPSAPDVPATAWLLVDHDSGRVLAEHNADKPLAPASLAKLMTTYVLFGKLKAGRLRLDDKAEVSRAAAEARGARLFLRPGTTVRVEDLVKGMIVHSANDAAVALAERASGGESSFVAEMNAAARALGLAHTVFSNVTGHDATGQVSTARDLARLVSALIRDFPEYYPWFALKEFTYNGLTQYNRNALLWRDGAADGVKTGQTHAAGFCLAASARRDGMRLSAVVLGAKDENTRVASGQRLLDYGFRYFETRLLYAADVPAMQVRVWMGDQSSVPLGVRHNLYVTLPRGWHERLHARLTVQDKLHAPVQYGQTVGTLALDLEGRPFAEYPLVALKEIGTGNLMQRAIDKFQLWLQ